MACVAAWLRRAGVRTSSGNQTPRVASGRSTWGWDGASYAPVVLPDTEFVAYTQITDDER